MSLGLRNVSFWILLPFLQLWLNECTVLFPFLAAERCFYFLLLDAVGFPWCSKIPSRFALPTPTSKLRFLFHKGDRAGWYTWSFMPWYTGPCSPPLGCILSSALSGLLLIIFVSIQCNLGGKKLQCFFGYIGFTLSCQPIFCLLKFLHNSSWFLLTSFPLHLLQVYKFSYHVCPYRHLSLFRFWSNWLPCDASSMLSWKNYTPSVCLA